MVRDKTKLSLERLKMAEVESSSRMLENKQQRQRFEKCFDEIANQVVQALLAHKLIQEEAMLTSQIYVIDCLQIRSGLLSEEDSNLDHGQGCTIMSKSESPRT